MKSIAENLLLWEQRIKEKSQTALTIEEWCKKNGVSKNQYYYWNHRLCQKQKPAEEMPFADVTPILLKSDMVKQNPVKSYDFQIFINDIRVAVPDSFSPIALAELMKVLQRL